MTPDPWDRGDCLWKIIPTIWLEFVRVISPEFFRAVDGKDRNVDYITSLDPVV